MTRTLGITREGLYKKRARCFGMCPAGNWARCPIYQFPRLSFCNSHASNADVMLRLDVEGGHALCIRCWARATNARLCREGEAMRGTSPLGHALGTAVVTTGTLAMIGTVGTAADSAGHAVGETAENLAMRRAPPRVELPA